MFLYRPARVALWSAVAVWTVFAGMQLIVVLGLGYRSVGLVHAGATAYALTLLMVFALPRWRLVDVALVVAAAISVPDLAYAASEHVLPIARWGVEMLLICLGVLPIVTDRLRREFEARLKPDQISLGMSAGSVRTVRKRHSTHARTRRMDTAMFEAVPDEAIVLLPSARAASPPEL